jgi:cellulose synthase/poly-beta-1,6-N-acetylglucosamine synthase-like glycosyltransferase
LLINGTLLAASVLLFVPGLIFFIECFASLFRSRSSSKRSPLVRPRVDVLVPAHNEATGIGATIESLLKDLAPEDRLVVVADNCTDNTAEIARAMGARVIERHDPEHRGKGYALDFGIKFLAQQPPDVVILMDADCVVVPGTFERIAHLAIAHNRPVQSTYLFQQPAVPTARNAISTLAIRVKNLVRPLGLHNLGLPCPLTGTGMAFPWPVIKAAPLASGNIVEDMNLGLDLAISGYPPMFCSEGRVTSTLPQQDQASKSQRTRWEHGHLATIQTQVPKLFRAAFRKMRFDLFAMGLDLVVPPMSLLVMLWMVGMVIAAVAAFLGATFLPAMILGIEGLLIITAVVSAWAKYSRAELPASMLLTIPFYILSKIPLYFAFLFKPQKAWVRTERDVISDP